MPELPPIRDPVKPLSAGSTGGPAAVLARLGIVSCGIYGGLTWLSVRFDGLQPAAPHPILPFLALLAIAFVCYLAAVRVAVKAQRQRSLLPLVFGFGLAFRVILVWSTPLLEIDIYRYLWDGLAATEQVNPYRYSPLQVRHAQSDQPLADDLARLVHLRDSSAAAAQILSRLHYPELTTLYPPVSQAVFAAAAWSVPRGAGVTTRLVVMKFWLLLFDAATVALLVRILVLTGKPVGWSVAYAWCPLVLKEIANSGHLDSIAVCLTTAAVWFALEAVCPMSSGEMPGGSRRVRTMTWLTVSGIALGLGVGAKIYPVVIAPLIVVAGARQRGWRGGCLFATAFAATSVVVLCPMWLTRPSGDPLSATATNAISGHAGGAAMRPGDADRPAHLPPLPPGADDPSPPESTAGLTAFMAHWEMNDFLFAILFENLHGGERESVPVRPWFVVTGDRFRESFTRRISATFGLQPDRVPYVVSRAIAGTVFILVAVYWTTRGGRARRESEWGEAVFLTLAWFWLLLPTQNPWYWIWALPFLPFARSRAWLAVSGLTLLYYARFWFARQWPTTPVPPTVYPGKPFFDYVVVWIEFAPWFVWLGVEYLRRRAANPMQAARPDGKP